LLFARVNDDTHLTSFAPIMEDPSPIRILVVDDHADVRAGLRMRLALEPDLLVVGEAPDARAITDLVAGAAPDVVVMDIVMPGQDGIAATALLTTVAPDVPVVLLSLFDGKVNRARGRAAGAAAFIGKHEAERLLVPTLRRLVRR
jgi:DNA-binding NarL/FixJ family response regulator